MARIEETKIGADGWSEWMRPIDGEFREVCCDCGLAHDLQFRIGGQFRIEGGRVPEFRARRNERSMGQVRRHMKKRIDRKFFEVDG